MPESREQAKKRLHAHLRRLSKTLRSQPESRRLTVKRADVYLDDLLRIRRG